MVRAAALISAAVACPLCSLLPLWRSQPPVVILAPRALSACTAVLHHQMHAVAGWQKLTHIPKSVPGASLKHPASSARGGLPLLWSGVWGEGVLSREKPGGESESLQEMETILEQRETPPALVCGAVQELSNVLFLLLCISVEAWEMEVVTMPRSCPETSSRTKVRSPHLVKINMLTGAPETLQNSPLQPLCHSFCWDATSSHSCSRTLCSQGPLTWVIFLSARWPLLLPWHSLLARVQPWVFCFFSPGDLLRQCHTHHLQFL